MFTQWCFGRRVSDILCHVFPFQVGRPLLQEQVSGDDTNPERSSSSISVVEAPHRADLVVQLVRHLKPQIVITSLADFEMRTTTAFEKLLEATQSIGARVFLDISEHVELSSLPGTNGVLQYLAVKPLPPHATIICGLVKNQVCL